MEQSFPAIYVSLMSEKNPTAYANIYLLIPKDLGLIYFMLLTKTKLVMARLNYC